MRFVASTMFACALISGPVLAQSARPGSAAPAAPAASAATTPSAPAPMASAGMTAAAPASPPAAPAAPTAGDPAAGKAKTAMCSGCHGIPGWRTAYPEVYSVPMIHGQHQAYLIRSLQAYRNGERSHPSMRAIAASLSDQDIVNLAAYYGASAEPRRPVAPDSMKVSPTPASPAAPAKPATPTK